MQMAQQSPLSKSLSVANSAATPLTLANPFQGTPASTPNTFADRSRLPGRLFANLERLRAAGPGRFHGHDRHLPGHQGHARHADFPAQHPPRRRREPLPGLPSGFQYVSSNGNSTRESGTVQLRRRLHSGIAASAQYTYSHSLDDAALGGRGGGQLIAQDWLNLSAERGPSNFDQRRPGQRYRPVPRRMGVQHCCAGGRRGAEGLDLPTTLSLAPAPDRSIFQPYAAPAHRRPSAARQPTFR